jgi:predicted nucleic acid-binding protein
MARISPPSGSSGRSPPSTASVTLGSRSGPASGRATALTAWPRWSEVTAVDVVRRHAERLVETHPIRAADALQIGAALVAAAGDPETLELVTLDRRLAEAAEREGFPVLGVA